MFALTRLLAFLPMGNFIRGPLGKVLLGAGVVIVVFLGFKIWLVSHDNSVRDVALTNFTNAQLEQTIRDKELFDQRMAIALQEQTNRLNDLATTRDALTLSTEDIIKLIESGNLEGGPSSPVLRAAIEALVNRNNTGGNQ